MRAVFAIALCFVVGACDNSTGPEEAHVGTYVLQTIGGEPLPAVVLDLGVLKIEVLAIVFELKSNGTFQTSGTFRTTDDEVVTTEMDTETGEYTLQGTALTLVGAEETMSGTLVGETVTFSDPNGDMVFVKV